MISYPILIYNLPKNDPSCEARIDSVEAESLEEATKACQDKGYGLSARQIDIFAPGTTTFCSKEPLKVVIFDYSENNSE